MKHFDLFSGYGGFSLALENVYGDKKLCLENKGQSEGTSSGGQEGLCEQLHKQCIEGLAHTIGFSEIDKYASAVLKYRWPNIQNYGDIKKINWSEVPDFDLLTGGSPCQDLSIAGKRAGLSGQRSGLFYEFIRAVNEKKPKYFIWENVKGALSSQTGWDFAAVLNEMAEAGYSLWWQVLNAKDFGVPQNRERIFVIGFRDGSPREIFFERQNDGIFNKENDSDKGSSQAKISGTLKSSGAVKADDTFIKVVGTLDGGGWEKRNESIRRVHSPEGLAPTTPTGQGGGVMTKIIQRARGKNNGGEKDICPTISKSSFEHNNHLSTKDRIRRLTPTECERLMGLPDGWTSKGIMKDEKVEISDSQRYKMCGNGVVVNVVEEIIKNLIK